MCVYYLLNAMVEEIKWVLKVIGELLGSIFLAMALTVVSMPKETQTDKTMFIWLFTILFITGVIIFLVNIYFVSMTCRLERQLMKSWE